MQNVTISFEDFNILKLLASIMFLWACYHQFKSNVILGKLRKDKNGEAACKVNIDLIISISFTY